MDIPNAFIGKAAQPTPEELSAALGPAADVWNQFLDRMAEQGVAEQEWASSSPKYGWSLLLEVKKRRIVYLSPCAGCFRTSFVLGDRAVAAALASDLPNAVLQTIQKAPRYGEGTGIRLMVKAAKDLPAICKLALIKLAN
ncbi:MAG: DUF3788 domain-containing protein [Terracidiphilus sp.]|jgi:hypothetical protein